MDVKVYLRVGADGQPQVVRVEPLFLADDTFVSDMVRIYVDEAPQPDILTRHALWHLLQETGCAPIEEVMNYKHKMRN